MSWLYGAPNYKSGGLCILVALVVALAMPATARSATWERIPGPDGVTLDARFYKPEGAEPVAAVVALHGCSGLRSRAGQVKQREAAWAQALKRDGYAVLLVDSFGSRGHRSICQMMDRPVEPDRERPGDAYAALHWLQARPDIKANRIALIGWSNGAMSVLWTLESMAPQRPQGLVDDFRAGAAFYPGCVRLGRTDYRPVAPVLLQVGLADDWTRPGPCLDLAAKTRKRGGEMEIDAYAGARHGFDHPDLPPKAVVTRHRSYAGGEKTVHVGTHPAARRQAMARVRAWLRERLGE